MGSKLFTKYRCHRACASTSETQPAKLLAVFVVDTNETELTIHSETEATALWREPTVTLQ